VSLDTLGSSARPISLVPRCFIFATPRTENHPFSLCCRPPRLHFCRLSSGNRVVHFGERRWLVLCMSAEGGPSNLCFPHGPCIGHFPDPLFLARRHQLLFILGGAFRAVFDFDPVPVCFLPGRYNRIQTPLSGWFIGSELVETDLRRSSLLGL